jgi:pyruvate dehydrogenase E1 component
MFGFQRIGDLAWLAGDMQARGFLIGGTAGRTTLNGEGLQHEDGHSHLMAATIPNCLPYDPTYAHEVAVIIQDGLRRMVENQENVYYYLTVMNENYPHPGLKPGDEEGIVRGMYKLKTVGKGKQRVQLMGSGTILREVEEAAALLDADWGIASDVWSVTSFTLLRRDGLDVQRHNMLHPEDKKPQVPYVTKQLEKTDGPIIASTDYMKLYADQIRPFIPKGREYRVLGTDGFGRSDFRYKLREHFEIDRHFVVVAALKALADEGAIPVAKVAEAIKKYGINPEKANPHHA